MKRLFLLALIISLIATVLPATTFAAPLADYGVPGGHFYTQTNGDTSSTKGYSITDDDGVPLWSEVQRLGGVAEVGYPGSSRFMWDGFVSQAVQKGVLQWRPETGRAVFVNVFDLLHQSGKDDWLLAFRNTPKPATFPPGQGRPFAEVVQERVSLLDANPAIRAKYYSVANPIDIFGLPTTPVVDIGPAFVLRAQRAVFQQWKVDMPFARAGDVTVANGGDVAKEAGLLPASAVALEEPPKLVVTSNQARIPVDQAMARRLTQVADAALPGIPKIIVPGVGSGTGVVFDPQGFILTAYHVVTESETVQVQFPDGRTVTGRLVGADPWTDLAVIKVPTEGLKVVPLVGANETVRAGDFVVAVGYSPSLPRQPHYTAGTVQSSTHVTLQGEVTISEFIPVNAPLFPGYSGGPLLNLDGKVIGIDTAVARRGSTLITDRGFAVAVPTSRDIIDELKQMGQVKRPWLGVVPVAVSPDIAAALGLPADKGVLLLEIVPGGPADRAGLKAEDIIVAVDGRTVDSVPALLRALATHSIGEPVALTVVTGEGARKTVRIVLEERGR